MMKIYSIRLCEDQVAAIDAGDVSRSDFIRDAIGVALDGLSGPKKNSIAPPGDADDGSVTSFNKPKRSKKADPAVAAVKAAVGAIKPKVAPARRSAVISPRAQDIKDVLQVIRSGRFSSRDVECRLSWAGLRYQNAEKALLASGKIRVEDGVLVVRDE